MEAMVVMATRIIVMAVIMEVIMVATGAGTTVIIADTVIEAAPV